MIQRKADGVSRLLKRAGARLPFPGLRTTYTALGLLLYFASSLTHGGDSILLQPERAFRFSARAIDARRLEVTYMIAPGYALYRDRFKFEVEPRGAALGAAQIPPGIMKDDPFFGRVAVFRDEVKILLSLVQLDTSIRQVTLKVTSQGCADAGICYVRQHDEAKLTLPAAASSSRPSRSPAPEAR